MKQHGEVLRSLLELLRHVQEVERDVMELSRKSTLKVSEILSRNKVPMDEDAAWVMQHQDIISQQLSATTEAIGVIEQYINRYLSSLEEDTNMVESSITKLDEKLQRSLEIAREKKGSFTGKIHGESDHGSDGVEFF